MCQNISIKKALEMAVQSLDIDSDVSRLFGDEKLADELKNAADILSLEYESVRFDSEKRVEKQVCVYCDEFRENCDCQEKHGFSGSFEYINCIERKMITEKLEIKSKEELVYEQIDD